MDTAKHSKPQAGQGLVEYALLLALVGLVASFALAMTGTSVREVFCTLGSKLGGQGCGCTSSFDNPNGLEEWTGSQREEYFSIEDGKACNSGPKSSFLNACSTDFGSSDFTADLNGITIEQIKGGNRGFDFLFRSQDENNGYHFTYNSSSHLIRFWKRVNGKWILMSSKKAPSQWSQQSELNFQVKVEGDTFTAYKDGGVILQASDDAYTEGQFGMRNKPGSKTCIGDLSVQQSP